MSRQDLFDAVAQVSDTLEPEALDAIVEFVAEWIQGHGDPGYLSEVWREEMGE